MNDSDSDEELDAESFEELLEAIDAAIVRMAERISDGDFDDEHEQLRIDRLNALANAVDARRRAREEQPEKTLVEALKEEE